MVSVADVARVMDGWYPPGAAEPWDRVGLVVGEPEASADRVLFVVDCVPETVEQAIESGVGLIVAHHPLLLRGVSSVATTSYKGRVVHRLIRAGLALFVAHTNADTARPGVSDALADVLGLVDTRPLRDAGDGTGGGIGRVGALTGTVSLAAFADRVARALPATVSGVRCAGEPDRPVRTVAVCGGAGDEFLADAAAAGADAYLTADLRHHPASEYLAEGGPALLDAAHWATEWPWLPVVAARCSAELGVQGIVSSLVTDPWTRRSGESRPG